MTEAGYPLIGDYALIGDCHSSALVSKRASVDWCCMPRFDSASIFGRLLDWERGGYFSVAPEEAEATAFRRYLDDTLVLVTTFETRSGEASVYDCFAMVQGGGTAPRRQLLRVVEGDRGTVAFAAHLQPRFDYAGVRPWLRHHGAQLFSAIGGNDSIVVTCDEELTVVDRHDLESHFVVRAGSRVRMSVTWYPPEEIDPEPTDVPGAPAIDDRLDETIAWWKQWTAKIEGHAAEHPEVRRSAVVLKALTHAPTGAVVAAATTSLPESVGHGRNWDYRYSWIRDSQFTVRSLGQVGCENEADGFRRFVERSAAGSAESLQIMYGVGGERRLVEMTLDGLDGYCGSRPVRVGNAAAGQFQLDVYGYLLDLAWRWHQRGRSPDDDYWRFLMSLVDAAAEQWTQPDCGIWEVRHKREHFVHSKVMCWVTLDRGLRLAELCLRQAPTRRWAKVRDEIRESVETDGYDQRRGVFRRAYGSRDLDAALLLLPAFDFISYDDERMVRTTAAIRKDLDEHGFVRRYNSDDGMKGHEGCFIACTFWLAEVLARQGQLSDAQVVFDRAAASANDVGIFSEELDSATGDLLGNTPQGLTHLSHIAAAVALADALAEHGEARSIHHS